MPLAPEGGRGHPDRSARAAAAFAAAIDGDTRLVSLIQAQHETGVIQPVAEVIRGMVREAERIREGLGGGSSGHE